MRRYIRPILLGLACCLFGMGLLFAGLKLSPDTAKSLFGSGNTHSSKPIVSALNLSKPQDDEGAPQGTLAQNQPSQASDEAEDDFLGPDPFMAARKLHEQIEKEMRAGFAGLDAGQDSDEIVTKEDEKAVTYEIKGVEGGTLNTSVKNGYLTISGESKKESGGMSIQSSFHRMFPLPPSVDSTKMETLSEKDKVVLRFPKRHG